MTPVHFTRIKNGHVQYHYSFKELKAWYALGKKEGNVGFILWSTNEKTKHMVYKGFGTIENPKTTVYTLHINHFELMDGKWKTPEEQLIAPVSLITKYNTRMLFLDTSEFNT